jgi:hypothetical protein
MSRICKIFVNVPEVVSGTASFQVEPQDTVSSVVFRVSDKFHLASTEAEAASKYALVIRGLPDPPKYLPTDATLAGLLPNEQVFQVRRWCGLLSRANQEW